MPPTFPFEPFASKGIVVMHVDGSNVFAPPQRSTGSARSVAEGIGWAVVACHDDQLHERHGGIAHHRRGPLTGCHEQVAFIQGVRYAHELGLAFERLTIVCDDILFGHAQVWLHQGNFFRRRAAEVLQRMDQVLLQLYQDQPHEAASMRVLVLHALQTATILKVKGHQRMVYQERADYLAGWGAQSVCGLSNGPVLSYDDWLENGIDYYDREQECQATWRAPFMG